MQQSALLLLWFIQSYILTFPRSELGSGPAGPRYNFQVSTCFGTFLAVKISEIQLNSHYEKQLQWTFLLLCVGSICVRNSITAAFMLMGGVATSRLGLWMFDLAVVQQMQVLNFGFNENSKE